MLTYLLIFAAIALALAPLAQILPSKRQRKLARMREYAALHGLFVEFRPVPCIGGEPRPSGQVIYYGKRLPASLPHPVKATAWVKSPEGWRALEGRLPMPGPVENLSVEILAAGIDQSSCGVYWTESGEEDSVEQIRLALEQWEAIVAR